MPSNIAGEVTGHITQHSADQRYLYRVDGRQQHRVERGRGTVCRYVTRFVPVDRIAFRGMLEADSHGSARKRPVRQPHQPEQSTQQLGRQAHRAAELLARIRRSILTGQNLEQSTECDHGPLALGTMASWIRW